MVGAEKILLSQKSRKELYDSLKNIHGPVSYYRFFN